MNASAERQLPPSDRTEAGEANINYPHDGVVRGQLLALRDAAGWSNNKIAAKMGVNSSYVSQYLNPDGCRHPGDIPAFERKAADLLRNEARRRTSGVETVDCALARELATAFEFARKTNDVGVVIAESGDGKTRGIEPYVKANPTCHLFNVCSWHRHEAALRKFFFDAAAKGDWDKQTNWMDYACLKLRGTDRLFILDNAHKLPLRSLQLCMDFHDETQCPLALVGTYMLVEKLQKDPQIFSRVGLHWLVGERQPRELVKHLIRSLIPKLNGEAEELLALCEQVAAQAGHFRAVHKQLKLAVEMRENSTVFKTWCQAFKAAHTKMLRSYKLG